MFFSLGHESLNRNIVKNVDIVFSQASVQNQKSPSFVSRFEGVGLFLFAFFHSSNDMNIRYLAKLQTYQ